jgi:hypothetical protein
VVLASAAVACTSTTGPSIDRGTPLGTSEGGTTNSEGGTTDGAAPGCHSDASARLVCDRSKLDGAPWGPLVTMRQAIGHAPAPAGGVIVPDAYQLVSETLYGSVQPNTAEPHVGDRVQRVLHVDCDVMNELYRYVPNQGAAVQILGTGNDCRRLVARELSVLEASGWMGAGIPDSRDQVSYTAHETRLTLIFLHAYHDPSRHDLGIMGSYTVVSEFRLVSGEGLDASAPTEDAGASYPIPTGRDPRCPANPPASGDPCSPDPAPLECEYGGDAFHRCTTYAACVMDLSGAFHFSVDPPSACTPPNPPACPSSFAEASTLAARLDADGGSIDAGSPLDGIVCNYAEGVCGCGIPYRGATCVWSCNSGRSLPDGGTDSRCPMPRPLAGDPCTPGLECAYDVGCGDTRSLGPSMICTAGYWENRGDMWLGCPEL